MSHTCHAILALKLSFACVFAQPFKIVFNDDVRAKFRPNVVCDSCATLTFDIQTTTTPVHFCSKESIYFFAPPRFIAFLWANTTVYYLITQLTPFVIKYSTYFTVLSSAGVTKSIIHARRDAVHSVSLQPACNNLTVLQGKPVKNSSSQTYGKKRLEVNRWPSNRCSWSTRNTVSVIWVRYRNERLRLDYRLAACL